MQHNDFDSDDLYDFLATQSDPQLLKLKAKFMDGTLERENPALHKLIAEDIENQNRDFQRKIDALCDRLEAHGGFDLKDTSERREPSALVIEISSLGYAPSDDPRAAGTALAAKEGGGGAGTTKPAPSAMEPVILGGGFEWAPDDSARVHLRPEDSGAPLPESIVLGGVAYRCETSAENPGWALVIELPWWKLRSLLSKGKRP